MVGGPPCSYHVGVRERRWLPTGAVARDRSADGSPRSGTGSGAAWVYLLQSVLLTTHSPALFFSQAASAARRAASRSPRTAAPACLVSPVSASAPHIRGPILCTTLHPLAPHSPSAASSARFGDGWFQLAPYFPVLWSHEIAP